MVNKKKYKILIKFLFLYIFLIILNNLNNILNNKYLKIFQLKEIRVIETYLKLCSKENIIIRKKFKLNIFPKISIISPIYNRGYYVLRFLRSIQNQYFNDFEIILIDDSSKDNSVKLIEKYKKEDERILLIKNKINKGTFRSRNYGVLISKGKYLIIPDPDDILSNDILNSCYNLAELNNYEIIRFNIYLGNNTIFFENIVNELDSKPIYQHELSTYLYYAKGILQQVDFNVCNKFIKREAYIRALNFMKKEYLNLYIINQEDGIMNFFLYRTSKSFYFYKKIGYYYIRNKKGSYISQRRDKTVRFFFLHLKIVFEYTKNTKIEKDMANHLFQRLCVPYPIEYWLKLVNTDFYFFYDIINNYLNCDYISIENKKKLIKFNYIIKRGVKN